MTWIGNTDLRAVKEADVVGIGPIAQALESRPFHEAYLVTDFDERDVAPFTRWLHQRGSVPLNVFYEGLSGPTQFGEIYEAAVRSCQKAVARLGEDSTLTFHLSPGTPAMAAVWIILSKTRFPAELIESSRQHGVQTASVPFDISADFIPDLLRKPDKELAKLSEGLPPEAPEFSDIVQGSRAMKRTVLRARRVAPRSIPVLIEGETGTGKELLARAIHTASPRREQRFVAVNCGAIPAELVESELFGHEKGAFTGAVNRRMGYFEEASGGTLFLDEIGELPKLAQVKLLRVLQESEIVAVGSPRPRKVDVRVIAATNRSLQTEVAHGQFREDLFHRLAVAVLQLQPLRERREDLVTLIDRFLAQVNREAAGQPGCVAKKLSARGRHLLLHHPWPGNARELLNTLRRAALWSTESTLAAEDIADALIPVAQSVPEQQVLGRPLGDDLKVSQILTSVARHYIDRALEEAHGNKTKAARLIGLPSYQTLTNWMKRYGVEV